MRIALLLVACTSGLPPGATDGAPADLAVADSDVDRVPCQGNVCLTGGGNVCCIGTATACQAPPCAANTFVSFACDGPEDCHGQLCCYDVAANQIACSASCGMGYHICHTNADCNPGECCLQLEASAPVGGCYSNGCP